MKFYSDIAATLGVWNGSKMLTFEGGVYETDDPREIALLKNAGYRHDKEVEAECQSQSEKIVISTSKEQQNTFPAASTPKGGLGQPTETKKKPLSKQQKK